MLFRSMICAVLAPVIADNERGQYTWMRTFAFVRESKREMWLEPNVDAV